MMPDRDTTEDEFPEEHPDELLDDDYGPDNSDIEDEDDE